MSTIKDLSRLLGDKASMSQNDSNAFVVAFFDIIKDALLKEGIVKVKGLGTFKMMTVKQRESVNVNTGERVIIDSHDRVSFTPDNTMRDAVNKPFSQFETVVLNEGVNFDDMEVANENNDETPAAVEPEPVVTEPEPVVTEPEPEPVVIEEEPVVEDEPATEPEPVVEDEPTAEPEEPAVEDEPIAEDEPIVEDEQPVTEDEPVTEETTEEIPDEPEAVPTIGVSNVNTLYDDDDDDEEYDDDEKRERRAHYLKVLLHFAALAIIVSFIFITGLVFGRVTHELRWADLNPFNLNTKKIVNAFTENDQTTADSDVAPNSLLIAKIKEEQAQIDSLQRLVADIKKTNESLLKDKHVIAGEAIVKDSVAKTAKVQPTTAATTKPATAATAATTKPATAATTKPATAATQTSEAWDYRKFETDPRIKHGAYRIVGVARTIKVKPGETLHSITARTLGAQMDCYVEALNGKEVAPGQMLKLPKLEIKKKKK